MTKEDFIARYGEAAYEEHKLKNRARYKEHREHYRQLAKAWRKEHKDYHRDWCEQHKEQYSQQQRDWREQHKDYHRDREKDRRIKGCTPYCTKNYDLIANYELAKADNFDPKKWRLHHLLENYWSKATLKMKGLYYDVNPEALIWLPYDEHKRDIRCKNSKWHKRILEK